MINQIICAAIKMNDGAIFLGHRHHNCISIVAGIERYKGERVTQEMQGFISSENKFVNRVEALEIQLAANISSIRLSGYGNKLYSEDLY